MTQIEKEPMISQVNPVKIIDNKVNLIKKLVAAYHGETTAIYSSRNRKREKLMIKHIAIYLCFKMVKTAKGLPIGPALVARYFGFTHASVIHINKKISGFIDYDRVFRLEIEKIEQSVLYKIQMRENKPEMKNLYFIDLNESVSMKLSDTKAIVLTGFDDDEVEKIKNLFRCPESRKHKETSMYILETQASPKE